MKNTHIWDEMVAKTIAKHHSDCQFDPDKQTITVPSRHQELPYIIDVPSHADTYRYWSERQDRFWPEDWESEKQAAFKSFLDLVIEHHLVEEVRSLLEIAQEEVAQDKSDEEFIRNSGGIMHH